jgi:hypothetical protein
MSNRKTFAGVVGITRFTCIIIVAFCALFHAACADRASPQQGEEVLAFDPNAVVEISVKAGGIRLLAHRWKSKGSPFSIAVFTPAGVSTCTAGEGFLRALAGLRSIKTGQILSLKDTRRLQENDGHRVRIRLVIDSDIEIEEWTFYLPEGRGSHVVGQSEQMERAAELSIGLEPFLLLQQGCRALGATLDGN